MNNMRLFSFLASALLVISAGCAKQRLTQQAEPVCVSNIGKADALLAAEIVLEDMHFMIEKIDRQAGYIRTRPLQGAQFFEFWRSDNVGSFNTAESNMHTIRRTAEILTEDNSGKFCIGCKVYTQRLSLSQFQGTSQAIEYDRFGSIRTGANTKMELSSEQKQWIDLGRDDLLAAEILKRIENKVGKVQ